MTQEMFDRCLYVCDHVKDGVMFHRIVVQFPELEVNFGKGEQEKHRKSMTNSRLHTWRSMEKTELGFKKNKHQRCTAFVCPESRWFGSVGRRLQLLRAARGYAQEQMAKKVGISTSFYANIERDMKGISIFALHDLAQILSVSVEYLLDINREEVSASNIEAILKKAPPAFVASMDRLICVCKEEFEEVD